MCICLEQVANALKNYGFRPECVKERYYDDAMNIANTLTLLDCC